MSIKPQHCFKTYEGTKRINAKPMTRIEYNVLRGWELPKDENGEDDGYLVEYHDGGKSNHKDFEGYISWSPKDVFESTYHEIDPNKTFVHTSCDRYQVCANRSWSWALNALLDGNRVQRGDGWNAKGLWVTYSPGVIDLPSDKFFSQNTREYAEQNGGVATVSPSFMLKNVNGEITYWVPSIGDIIATDWSIV